MLAVLNAVGVDAVTLAAGTLSSCIRPIRRYMRQRYHTFNGTCWESQKVVMDFLNGAAAIPFALLVASAFYSEAAPVLVANKAAMVVAGAIGLIFVVGEILTAGRDD